MSSVAQPALFEARQITPSAEYTFGIEGPAVDASGDLYVVNYQKRGTIGRVKEGAAKSELFLELPTGSVANSIRFGADLNMYIADYTGHNVLVLERGEPRVYFHSDQFNQPNDICINKKGQLFASDPSWKTSTGKLWRIEPDGKAILLTAEMGTTNGIELSPDEKILYVNESVQHNIWAFDVDGQGNISNKRLFHKFDDFGMDGMKCDRDGNLYATRYGKGVVAILSPDGKLVREVTLKGKRVSNIIFGGKDGKTCFVTLQDRKGMEMFRSEVAGKKWK